MASERPVQYSSHSTTLAKENANPNIMGSSEPTAAYKPSVGRSTRSALFASTAATSSARVIRKAAAPLSEITSADRQTKLARPATRAIRPSNEGGAYGGPRAMSHANWDVRERLQAMEQAAQTLRDQVDKLSTQLKDRTCKAEAEVKVCESNFESRLLEERSGHVTVIEALKAELRTVKTANASELTSLMRDKAALEAQISSLQSSLMDAEASTVDWKSKCDRAEVTLKSLKTRYDRLASESDGLRETLMERDVKVVGLETQVRALEERAEQDESMRRTLHNMLQELKGNIRVFCRVRTISASPTSHEPPKNTLRINYPWPDLTALELNLAPNRMDVTGSRVASEKRHDFRFDRVFPPTADQRVVFDEVSQLVQSVLDGYQVCIFAYGQTGSGKTYTMVGPESGTGDDVSEGITPRAIRQVFEASEKLRDRGWTTELTVGCLEIYNEVLRDLLDPTESAPDPKRHEIKHETVGKRNTTTVTNQRVIKVSSLNQIKDLLRMATHSRAAGETRFNVHSSRSHAVFQLNVHGTHHATGQSVDGMLNLIDLAGSERISTTGSGDRVQESIHINRSLSCLKDVISALANRDKHVPYRNSRLTNLLKNSLGGQAKTLMFVNLSPSEEHAAESLNSLRFATLVNSCAINTAVRASRVDLNAVGNGTKDHE